MRRRHRVALLQELDSILVLNDLDELLVQIDFTTQVLTILEWNRYIPIVVVPVFERLELECGVLGLKLFEQSLGHFIYT